jgi:hypothetical protein
MVVVIKKTPHPQLSPFQLRVRTGRKRSQGMILCFQFVILVMFSNQIFFRVRKLNLFPDLKWKLRLVLSSNGHNHCSIFWARHANIRWKSEKDVYKLVFNVSWVFILNCGNFFETIRSLHDLSRTELQQHPSTSINHKSWVVDLVGHVNTHWQDNKVLYILGIKL